MGLSSRGPGNLHHPNPVSGTLPRSFVKLASFLPDAIRLGRLRYPVG